MKFVGVTSCPTGIAHTFMAAESLEEAAEEMGHSIKVETHGSVGAENKLTEKDIEEADGVIIAADTSVKKERFMGKKLISVSVQEAIKNPKEVIEKVKSAEVFDTVEQVSTFKAERSAQRTGPYKHLMTGVSYMIPFVVAGGILIALSFVFGIYSAEQEWSFPWALMQIGGNTLFSLLVPILSAYIAFSIADRPGLVPGFVAGFLANTLGAGFLGGILGGFLAGYLVLNMKRYIKLPKTLRGLMPILILPLGSSLIVGLLMIYVIGTPVAFVNDALTAWLESIGYGGGIVLGLIIGLMMAFDMGGPVNKAAYTFATGLLASTTGISDPLTVPMAAVMAAGMTPPLGLALATVIKGELFTANEIEAGKAAWVLGASFITEGAIPFAASDPIRVIPSIMAGSAVTGVLSFLFDCRLAVPHGGIFVLFIPGVVGNLGFYLLSIAIGTVVTAALVIILKSKLFQK